MSQDIDLSGVATSAAATIALAHGTQLLESPADVGSSYITDEDRLFVLTSFEIFHFINECKSLQSVGVEKHRLRALEFWATRCSLMGSVCLYLEGAHSTATWTKHDKTKLHQQR